MLPTPLAILTVDDDATSLLVLSGHLKRLGYTVIEATGGQQALQLLERQEFSLIISDLRMPGIDGLTLLQELRNRKINTPFIVVTACGSIESAVEAMRHGAFDYLEKPYNHGNLQLTVQHALDFHQAVTENRQFRAYLQERFTFHNIISISPAMKETLQIAAKVAASPHTSVAIYGESGTGKEVLARAIHFASQGNPGNFVAVNCAAIPEALLESELFGHVKGAFTGADKERDGKFTLAQGGTIFLDEIGDMPLALQAKMLRVLEDRSYEKVGSNKVLSADFRVIVATHRNLAEMVRLGTFREDLFHRINVVPLYIPPLRQRSEDIPLLADHFLDQFRQHQGKALPGISKKAIEQLLIHQWPGNIRELRNTLEYAAIMVSDELIRPEHLRLASTPATPQPVKENGDGLHLHITIPPHGISLDSITEQVLQLALHHCNGNKSQAAALLKVDRKRFYR